MHMKVSVMEKDKLKDDLVGEAYIELGKYIMDRKEHEGIFIYIKKLSHLSIREIILEP